MDFIRNKLDFIIRKLPSDADNFIFKDEKGGLTEKKVEGIRQIIFHRLAIVFGAKIEGQSVLAMGAINIFAHKFGGRDYNKILEAIDKFSDNDKKKMKANTDDSPLKILTQALHDQSKSVDDVVAFLDAYRGLLEDKHGLLQKSDGEFLENRSSRTMHQLVDNSAYKKINDLIVKISKPADKLKLKVNFIDSVYKSLPSDSQLHKSQGKSAFQEKVENILNGNPKKKANFIRKAMLYLYEREITQNENKNRPGAKTASERVFLDRYKNLITFLGSSELKEEQILPTVVLFMRRKVEAEKANKGAETSNKTKSTEQLTQEQINGLVEELKKPSQNQNTNNSKPLDSTPPSTPSTPRVSSVGNFQNLNAEQNE